MTKRTRDEWEAIGHDVAYFSSILITLFFFVSGLSYILLTVSVNTGRAADLTGVEQSIQSIAGRIAKNPPAEEEKHLRDALSDLSAQRIGHQKQIDFGKNDYWGMTFSECAFAFNAACFHRNSSNMNSIYLGIASGILGICLLFFISIRNDAISPAPNMRTLSTLISLICLIPTGAIVGLLTLFILKGAKGATLDQISGIVQVETPFGIASVCILASFFSDRLLAALSRLLEHFGFAKTT
jgi:hypothetical protein